MSDLKKAAQQALEALENAEEDGNCEYGATAALRAALAQQKQEADYPEEKLQAVAEYISDKYHVWYGVGARDVEEVLRQSVSCGLVGDPPRREWVSLTEEDFPSIRDGDTAFRSGALWAERLLKERNT